MKTYRLDESQYEPLQKKIRRRSLIIGLLLALFISTLMTVFQQGPLSPVGYVAIFFLFFTMMLVPTLVASRANVKRLRKVFNSYQLQLGEDTITCQQTGMKTTTITRDSISNIHEVPGKELRIWADHNRLQIGIPQALEDYQDVVEVVRSWWKPGEDTHPPRFSQLFGWAIIPIIVIAIFVTTLASPIVVIPTAAVMVALLGWLLFRTVSNRQFGMANKIISVVLLGIMLLGFLTRLLLALMRMQ